MRRREAILALVALATPRAGARAQPQALVTLLSPGPADVARRNEENLIDGLRELGHVHGRTLRVERHTWSGDRKTLEPLLRKVLAAKPDVLVVGGLSLAQAAKRATSSTPIVVSNASDLLSAGIVQSYARPGGNLTGFTTLTDVMTGKRLEVLLQLVPAVRKVVLLQNPSQPLAKSIEAHTKKVAAALRVELVILDASDHRELESALDKLGDARADAVLLASDALFRHHSAMLIERALMHKAFVVHWLPFAAEQGALLVHGVDDQKQHQRVAAYVDRILKGARAADLPVEQVTSHQIIVNLKTARALGLKVSQTVLLRADKVIH